MTTAANPRPGTQRIIALVVLLVAGVLSLPVVAALLDGGPSENLIVPVQLVLMAVVGATVGYLLPGLAGDDSSTGRGAAFGALVGVATALLGLAVFSLLL